MKFIQKKLHIAMSDAEIQGKVQEYWIRRTQQECNATEYDYLSEPTGAIPPLVKQLNLSLENGLIRCKGRIDRSDFPSWIRNPALLGKGHKYTELLIQDTHQKVKHLGIGTCVIYLREKLGLWLPKARATVKKAITSCMTCRKMNTFSSRAPKFANPPQ